MPSYGLYRELRLSNKIGTIIMYTFFPRPNYIELSPWQSKAQGYVGEKYCTLVQVSYSIKHLFRCQINKRKEIDTFYCGQYHSHTQYESMIDYYSSDWLMTWHRVHTDIKS